MPIDYHQVLEHIVSGLTLAAVSYLLHLVRKLIRLHRIISTLPPRVTAMEHRIDNHELRIKALEVPTVG